MNDVLTESGFATLAEVADYLVKQCRIRTIPGNISFEPLPGQPDRTGAVQDFFTDHPEHRISISRCQRFIKMSDGCFQRLNDALPSAQQIGLAAAMDIAAQKAL